jgi:DNA ligase-1
MKTFEKVLSALNEIGAVPGKLDKQNLVAKHLADPDFEKVVVLLLNPFKRFYIKNYECPPIGLSHFSDEAAYAVFESLANRTLSGSDARITCGRLVASGFPGDLMIRILNKDPKAGFGESTVNKVKKGLIPDFPYMRCALPKDAKFGTWNWKKGVISQEKADGMYATLNKSKGDLSIMSRSGTPFNVDSFPTLVAASAALDDNTQTQGELLVVNAAGEIQPREIGNGILNKICQGGQWPTGMSPIYRAWDQLPIEQVVPKVKYNVGYAKRLENLYKQLPNPNSPIAVIDTRTVHSMEEAKLHYAEMLTAGKEGIILSDPDAPWIDSTSKFKIKFKLTATCELRVTGYRPGKGKNESLFGSLICESSDGLLEVAISGFKDAHRKEIFEDMANVIDSIVSVDSNMIMAPSRDAKKWSLFLPRFAEFRKDKSTADSLEKIKEQFEAAIASI